MIPIKPKLWNYGSGIKKGKLRPKAKEYLSQELKEYHRTGLTKSERELIAVSKKTYYINFELADTVDKTTKVMGSLSSPEEYSLEEGKKLILEIMKSEFPNYKFVNFYKAEESDEKQKETIITLIRGDEEFFTASI